MGQNSSSAENIAFPRLADLVIRARVIYSMAADRTIFRAIAMREEWIVAVSEDPHGLDGLITSGTYILDDPQLTLLPAFDDTHGKCPETSTGFALKPAHLPPILHSGTRVS